ncbi:MAG: aromatic ring-hydroxylating dioxygenase subunit alpha [Gammaproteobacteria bacterium]|nr:aromatic ring-hydroxylating dioxygenase subunit alpha [Gammaproteobacteria bacterium]
MNASFLDQGTIDKINSSIDTATGLPNHAYTSQRFFELERQQIFSRTWACIGHACALPQANDVKPIRFMGMPLIMVRNESGDVNVFHNVCSHRGNELVWEPCSGRKVITCPYHAWSYDLNGNLKATPHIGGHGVHQVDGFEKEKKGLKQVRSAHWMDLVFINISENQIDFDDYIKPLDERIFKLTSPKGFTALKPAATHGAVELMLNANWKLLVENNLESYHLPWVHPDLNAISKLEDHYHFYGGDLYAGQGSKTYSADRYDDIELVRFPKWANQVAEYPTLFPNVLLGFQIDHFWSMVIQPIAPDKTRENLHVYYLGESASGDGYEKTRKSRLDAWTKVFTEDIGVVEGMQRGRRSPAFTGGTFSPVMDNPTHHFNKWITRMLSDATKDTCSTGDT